MEIDDILSTLKRLPPSPEILPKLQKLLRDHNSNTTDIANLIKLDSSLTAQILKVSSSSYYGMTETSHNIEEAVNRIGFQDVHRIVGAVLSKNIFAHNLVLYDLTSQTLWEQCIRAGTVMHSLSKEMGEDHDSAYTIGLLHTIGCVIVEDYHNQVGIPGIDRSSLGGPLSFSMERDIIGFDNGQVAASLLQRWNFPRDIYEPIQYQYSPLESPGYSRLACLLSLTRQAIKQLNEEPDHLYETFKPDQAELALLNIETDVLIDAALDSQSTFEWLSQSV